MPNQVGQITVSGGGEIRGVEGMGKGREESTGRGRIHVGKFRERGWARERCVYAYKYIRYRYLREWYSRGLLLLSFFVASRSMRDRDESYMHEHDAHFHLLSPLSLVRLFFVLVATAFYTNMIYAPLRKIQRRETFDLCSVPIGVKFASHVKCGNVKVSLCDGGRKRERKRRGFTRGILRNFFLAAFAENLQGVVKIVFCKNYTRLFLFLQDFLNFCIRFLLALETVS